ncbi:GNAT family N-acetyltransferase [Chlorogloeopsis sp. ULAP02]|uniref:GNAT family N-acetyltransferase n=1 Tax=Chlorogloeopsis sp. ULAP02 TaxID=3107926 RepID=UPI0031367349
MIIIETPRLILQHLTLDDVDELARIYADPVVMKFYPSPYTYEQTQQQVERIINTYQQGGWSLWATIHKGDRKLIGRCGLISQLVDGQQEVEIGYLLAKEYWGQGLATEAAIACRNYGFEQLGFHRLISLIDPANIASQKVAMKNGMKYEKDAHMWGKIVRVYTVQK